MPNADIPNPLKVDFATHKYAHISTVHVTRNDLANLLCDSSYAYCLATYEEGMFVRLCEDSGPGSAEEEGFSKEFGELHRLLTSQGIFYLRLDGEIGEKYDGLTQLDW